VRYTGGLGFTIPRVCQSHLPFCNPNHNPKVSSKMPI